MFQGLSMPFIGFFFVVIIRRDTDGNSLDGKKKKSISSDKLRSALIGDKVLWSGLFSNRIFTNCQTTFLVTAQFMNRL